MRPDDIDVRAILYDLCEDEAVFEDGLDLVESGLLDSLLLMELLMELEDRGVSLQPTRIDRSRLRTVEGIEGLIREYCAVS